MMFLVCSKNLCVHAYEQYGIGADVTTEIRDNSDVVDLLITFCHGISQGDFRRFNPFPLGIEVKAKDDQGKESKKDFLLDESKVPKPAQGPNNPTHVNPKVNANFISFLMF
jgi:hypothetical protein